MRTLRRPGVLAFLLAVSLGMPLTAAAQQAAPRVRTRAQTDIRLDPAISERVRVVEPSATNCPPPPPVPACPPTEGAKRRLLPDDTVEVTFADGTVQALRPDGTSLTTYPDGTSIEETGDATIWRDKDGNETARKKKWTTYSHVPYATPPEPPTSGSTLDRWLARQNATLLTALQVLLASEADGQNSLNRYLEREKGMGIYEQIAARSELLERILTH